MEIIKRIKRSPELFFVCMATLFGIIFALLIPPFQTPDEVIHFYRAYETSELRLPEYDQEYKAAGSYLPKSIKETENVVRAAQIRFNPHEKYDLGWTKHALLNVPLDKSNRVFYDTVAAGPQYLPLSYLPQAVTIFILKMLDSPVVLMIYAVRVVNLLIWILLGFLAIKIFPWKKWSLATILLIPIMISQSISIGLDALVYGSAILFMAMLFQAIHTKSSYVTRRKTLILIVLGAIMVFGKITFAVLLPLILFIKSNKFQLNDKAARFLVITIPLAMFIGWAYFTKNIIPLNPDSVSSVQVESILSNPFIFPIELISTFFFVWGDSVTQSLIGNFGWLDTPLSAPFVALGLVLLVAALAIQYDPANVRPPSINRFKKIILLSIFTAYFLGVCLAMYIYSSQNSQRFITGVQGRYIIPMLVILLPVFYNSKIRTSVKTFSSLVQASLIILLLVSSITIFFRYYIDYYPAR